MSAPPDGARYRRPPSRYIRVVLCAVAGAFAGVCARGMLRERSAIHYEDPLEELLKLAACSVVGAVVGGVCGWLLNRLQYDRRV